VVGAVAGVALVWMLRNVVMMVLFSMLLAYALDPLVSRVQRIPLPRGARLPQAAAAGLVTLALVAVTIWAAFTITRSWSARRPRCSRDSPSACRD
jgi:predicted PurR-regulated permease PerM